MPGGAGVHAGPGFDAPLGRDAYAWWYVDALSDDGRHALTLIAFLGSVFSPYYAAARRRGPADPCEHVALNVALDGGGVRRWTMTERGAARLGRDAASLRIGPSALRWEGGALVIELDELALPIPRRVRGSVRLEPLQPAIVPQLLDADGRHRWQPIAPSARVTVQLDAPALRWEGQGYLDCNWGDEPLESAFASWEWSRTALADGGCLLHYDTRLRRGGERALHLHADRDGRVSHLRPTLPAPLARTRWGLARHAHDDARLLRTLEDGPFYARSLLATPARGASLQTMHESLSLDRFAARWVQALLPFRMPRRAG